MDHNDRRKSKKELNNDFNDYLMLDHDRSFVIEKKKKSLITPINKWNIWAITEVLITIFFIFNFTIYEKILG